jgi:Ran GTPase-activating protein (RanGAP) involved in mRNA processing and transport
MRLLDISSNFLGPDGAGHCASLLGEPGQMLGTLYMNQNYVKDEGANQLAKGLAANKSLRILELKSCDIG